ncbi:MAG: hypothetical protein H6765_04055 [Candidatus Peribacteria bacterium]|nr:MAG: hypothetical protein H6765_04055 [Candidatus Peribacteria bacterium]
MNYLQHQTLTNYFTDLEGKIAYVDSLPQEKLVAQSGGGEQSSKSLSTDTDYSQFIEGFFIPGKDKDFHNVIAWDKGDELYRTNSYEIEDINGDGKDDIFLIENNTLYVKYAKQKDIYQGSAGSYSTYYEM